jgi:hypothetical protein
MEPLDRYRIQRGADEEESGGNRRLVLMAAVVVLVMTALAIFWYSRRLAPDRAPAAGVTEPAEVPAAERAPLGAPTEPAEIPPLDLTDPLVRELIGQLSSRPEVATWLATDGIIRNFVVTVENVATGASPTRHLRRLVPSGPFGVATRGDDLVIDPRSYARYDGLAAAVASLEAGGLAKVYTMLKPRLEEAYRELGYPDGDFDSAVERATVRLLRTPVPASQIDVVPGGVSYKFESAALEGLTPPQKHLLRMGPANMRVVQDQLRAIARELGIPDSRLPPRP